MPIEVIDNVLKKCITPQLKEFLESENRNIIASIAMTSIGSPEQYECYDMYGNQVAYLRLRYGFFSVECPDCTVSPSYTVYESDNIEGYGNFASDDERIRELRAAFDNIEEWYSRDMKLVDVKSNGSSMDEFTKRTDISDQEILEKLYLYENTNLSPEEVMTLRRKGPSIGYHEAVLKLAEVHRELRGSYFPEADHVNGLSDEHIEAELTCLRDNPDQILYYMVRTINWLFGKSFSDFEKDFRLHAKHGWQRLEWPYNDTITNDAIDNGDDIFNVWLRTLWCQIVDNKIVRINDEDEEETEETIQVIDPDGHKLSVPTNEYPKPIQIGELDRDEYSKYYSRRR